MDPRYFKFALYQNNANRGNEGDLPVYKVTELEFDYCGDNFPFVEEKLYNRVDLKRFIWPKNTDYFISSTLNSDSFNTIDLKILRWSGDDCATDEEIDAVINNNWIELAIISSYFDFNNIENPIQTYLEDTNSYPLFVNKSSLLLVKVAQNEYVINDNLLYLQSETKGSFYNVWSKDLRPENNLNYVIKDNNNVFGIYILLAPEFYVYERNSFTFFDMFGLLGGIHQLLLLFGGYLVSLFSEKMFNLSILSKLYQIKHQLKDTNKQKINPVYELNSNKQIEESSKKPDEVSNKFLDFKESISKYKDKNEEI